MLIPMFRPTLRRKDYNSVLSCLVSDRISAGPMNREFTAGLCRALDVAPGITLSSFASCLYCAFEFLGLGPGDGVVISGLAPQEYLQVIESRGMRPLIVDVEPEELLPGPAEVERQLAAGAKAAVLHYSLGFLPEADDLFQLGIPVIEDISQAFGANRDGQPYGSLGQVGVLALDPGGIITAGCGGMVFSRDRRSAKALRGIAEHRFADQLLPDMNAALGLSQLREVDRFLSRRREIADLYHQSLERSRHSPLSTEQRDRQVDYSFPVLLKDGMPEVRRYASKKGIETQPAFKDAIIGTAGSIEERDGEQGSCPAEVPVISPGDRSLLNCRELLSRCLLFPLYPSLGKKDVQLICKVLSTLP